MRKDQTGFCQGKSGGKRRGRGALLAALLLAGLAPAGALAEGGHGFLLERTTEADPETEAETEVPKMESEREATEMESETAGADQASENAVPDSEKTPAQTARGGADGGAPEVVRKMPLNGIDETEQMGETERIGETEQMGETERIGETEQIGETEGIGETEQIGESAVKVPADLTEEVREASENAAQAADPQDMSGEEEERLPLTLVWSEAEGAVYMYNGTVQAPEAIGFGEDAPEEIRGLSLSVTYTDGAGNPVEAPADAGSYLATAVFAQPQEQYALLDETRSFTIAPAPVDQIIWQWEGVSGEVQNDAENDDGPLADAHSRTDQTWAYDGREHGPSARFYGVPSESGEPAVWEIPAEALQVSADRVRDAGTYRAQIGESFSLLYPNYTLTEAANSTCTLEIVPRKVRLIPEKGSEKVFGEKDPKQFAYKIKDREQEAFPFAKGIELQEDLGVVLERETGEKPGSYAFRVREKTENPNYRIRIDQEAVFQIHPLVCRAGEASISSRSGGFSFAAENLREGRLDENVKKKAVITAVFPTDNKGIGFSERIDDYIPQASKGRSFAGVGAYVPILDALYTSMQGGQSLSWTGKLPAGTQIRVALYGKGRGEEAWYEVSEAPAVIDVVPRRVGLVLSSDAGAWLGKEDVLTLSPADEGSAGEYVSVRYRGTRYYPSASAVIRPEADNAGAVHREQTAFASFVDVLNLEFSGASFSFVYDDRAFPVEAEAIRFANRDSAVRISLPEEGRITSVKIPGAKVTVPKEAGTDFTLDVSWTGGRLPVSGERIRVRYVDRGGNVGKGTGTVGRSSVQTPITLKTRPERNEAGYIGGSGGVLVVSGSACAGEPLTVTVGGMTRTTFATGKEIWRDENGSWEAIFSLADLPEGEPIRVTAAYEDVQGEGAALVLRYKAWVAAPALLSPVFGGMPVISGMAQPGSDVVIRVGERTYRAGTDAYGHFVLEGFRALLPGDTFAVCAQDVAGNLSAVSYTVPEAGIPALLTGSVTPLGHLFFEGGKDASAVYTALPVSVGELEQGEASFPLLLGMSYPVGTLTVRKTENGILVEPALNRQLFADPQACSLENVCLEVYDARPSAAQLRQRAGRAFEPGQEIRMDTADTLWIVCEQKLTMNLSDVGGLPVFHFTRPGTDPAGEREEKDRGEDDEAYLAEYLAYTALQQ